jgi:dipeptidyl aminopeptidase/acylaminoacyl peptidase
MSRFPASYQQPIKSHYVQSNKVLRLSKYIELVTKEVVLKHRISILLLCVCLLAACGGSIPVTTLTVTPNAITVEPTVAVPTTQPSSPETPAPVEPTATTAAPTSEPTAEPTPEPTAEPTLAPTPAPTEPPVAQFGQELLFLRQGNLIAFDLQASTERVIAEQVADFAAAPQGQRIALLRGEGTARELWIVERDGSNLRQITNDSRAEAGMAWNNDASILVYATSQYDQNYQYQWMPWAAWCASSEVRIYRLEQESNDSLGKGCDPSISGDGKRIAFSTPPSAQDASYEDDSLLTTNVIHLVNNQGQNGWDFAKADLQISHAQLGRLVYGPRFSPDGTQIAYHRFIGYQALVDVNLSQIAPSFKGGGESFGEGGGWLLPPAFSPNGEFVAVSEHNFSDARGFGGYDDWRVTVVKLDGSRTVAMPDGEQTMLGQLQGQVVRAQQLAWSPQSNQIALVLPPDWNADLSLYEPLEIEEGTPGELWLWDTQNQPNTRLAVDVDYASPLAWLP